MSFTKRKFLELTPQLQHKKCCALLKEYNEIASWIDLPPLDGTFEKLSNRFHDHAKQAEISLREPDFLVRQGDRASNIPFLPIAIYLDNIRSAHNVGSIIRTTEAFRLGSLYFSEKTPYIDRKKVKDCAMGAEKWVSTFSNAELNTLPGPKIALETVEEAPSLFSFDFPPSFTLMVGNEEYGLSKEALLQADYAVQIPLVGTKNSLNVATAFSIAAALISERLRRK